MNRSKEIKAGIGYTIGNILIKSVTFISLPIFTRIMSTAEFGIYNTYTAYEAIIAIFVGLGLYASVKNAMSDYPKQLDLYVSTIIRLSAISFLLFLLTAILFQVPLSSLMGIPQIAVIMLCLHSFGTALLHIENARLAIDYQYNIYLRFSIFNILASVLLSIVLILFVFTENRAVGRIIGATIPMFIIAVYIYLYEGRKTNFGFDRKLGKYALGIGLPLIGHYLSQSVLSQIDRIMITNLVGVSETGMYSFVYSIAIILQVIYYSTENVWGVWFFKQMNMGSNDSIHKQSNKYILLISYVAMGMLVVSREMIYLLAPETYWSSIDLFVPILLGIFMLFLYTIPVQVEYYYKKTSYIALMTGVAAIINLISNYFGIKLFGYEAAAYTTLISYSVLFAVHWLIAKKLLVRHSINIKEILDIKTIIVVFLGVVLVGVITIVLKQFPIIKYLLFVIFSVILGFTHRFEIIGIINNIKRRTK